MRGLKSAFTVRELKQALDLCPEDSQIFIMPEDSDGFRIGGVVNLPAQEPRQVWLLLEEDVAEHERDNEEVDEGEYLHEEILGMVPSTPADPEPKDVIKVRGKLKSA